MRGERSKNCEVRRRSALLVSVGLLFLPRVQASPAGGYAMNVLREYFKLVPERLTDHIVYSEQPLTGPVQTGAVVEVRLTVSATHDEQYLQIEDPILPALTSLSRKLPTNSRKSRRGGISTTHNGIS